MNFHWRNCDNTYKLSTIDTQIHSNIMIINYIFKIMNYSYRVTTLRLPPLGTLKLLILLKYVNGQLHLIFTQL